MKSNKILLASLCSGFFLNVYADNPASAPHLNHTASPFFNDAANNAPLPPLLQTTRPQASPVAENVLFDPTKQETSLFNNASVSEDKLAQHLQDTKSEIELLNLLQEKERLLVEKDPFFQRKRNDLIRLTLEKEYLLMENSLQEAKRLLQLNELQRQKQKLELENAISAEKQRQLTAELEQERAILAAKNALQEERNKQVAIEYEVEQARIKYELAQLEYIQSQRTFDTALLTERINLRTQLQDWNRQVNEPIEYREEPLVNGELLITDRRISLNGPIVTGTANDISERIHFFNNKNRRYPIFLVIENSAGGSVMEGMQIIKAIQSSDAPVYVVVKSFAASMAAIIAALAEHSYAYPHAIILHHQIWSMSFGNSVQQKESLALMQEWSQRAMLPVAQKMGLSLEQFIEQMYKNNSDGNWRAFADEAVKLKWIGQTILRIKELSYTVSPDNAENPVEQPGMTIIMPEQEKLVDKIDKDGKHYKQLPSLAPLDVYHLYNPENYYRW